MSPLIGTATALLRSGDLQARHRPCLHVRRGGAMKAARDPSRAHWPQPSALEPPRSPAWPNHLRGRVAPPAQARVLPVPPSAAGERADDAIAALSERAPGRGSLVAVPP